MWSPTTAGKAGSLQRIHFRALRGIHSPFDGAGVARNLFGFGGAADDTCDFRAREQPGEGEFQQRVAVVIAPRFQFFDAIPVGVDLIALATFPEGRREKPVEL